MPLEGKSISEDIREFHGGNTYSNTRRKFGKSTANRQAIAAAYANQRSKAKRSPKRQMRGR